MDPRIADLEKAAARWTASYLLSEQDFLGTIKATRVETLRYTRLRARGRTRRIVPHFGQTSDGGRPGLPARIEDFDPWNESSATLRAKTRQLVDCESCRGSKRMVCPTCSGRTRVRCPSCVGGMQLSLKTGKPIRCRSCRGKGDRSCPSCRTGTVTCQRCEGRGRMLHWLDIEERDLAIVFESPSNALAQSIAPCPFDVPHAALPVAPFRSWSGDPDQRPADVEAFVSGLAWSQRIDRRHDRILAIDYQSFAAESATIDYQLLGRQASLELKVWDQTVVRSPESVAPLRRRLALLGAGGAGASVAGLLLASWYGGRHAYLAASVHHSLLLAMALLLGLALLWPLSRIGLATPGKKRSWSWLPALLILMAQVATAATGYPSLRRAQLLAEQGHGAAALHEAAACADLRRDPDRCAELYDRLKLAEIRTTRIPEDAWRAAAERYYAEEVRLQAAKHARELTLATALAYEAESRFDELDALLQKVDAGRLQEDSRFPELLARLHRRKLAACFPRLDARCASKALSRARKAGIPDAGLAGTRKEGRAAFLDVLAPRLRTIRSSQPTSERLAACNDVEAGLEFLDVVVPDDPLRAEVLAKCQVASKAQQEAERRARERELRNEARRRETQTSIPLLCRDGTLSPTCVCGGPRRGCCSHHGGVAGCSQ